MLFTIFYYITEKQKWLIWDCGLSSRQALITMDALEEAGYTARLEPA